MRFESPLNICCLRLAGNSERLLEFLLEISPRASHLVRQPALVESDTPLHLNDMTSEHYEELVVERRTRTDLFLRTGEEENTFHVVCLSGEGSWGEGGEQSQNLTELFAGCKVQLFR